jgi:hypothetical protein
VIASRNLNVTQGVPASLSLCLYQLSDLAAFASNAQTVQGLGQLLACSPSAQPQAGQPTSPPDPGLKGMVGATRLFFQPGETRDLTLDRLDQTKYVAVAGGYSSMPTHGGTGFLLIPVHENKKLIFANTFQLQELDAWLLLNSQSLEFFPKLEQDLKASAADFADKPPQAPQPTPGLCPPSACDPAAEPAQAIQAIPGQPAKASQPVTAPVPTSQNQPVTAPAPTSQSQPVTAPAPTSQSKPMTPQVPATGQSAVTSGTGVQIWSTPRIPPPPPQGNL